MAITRSTLAAPGTFAAADSAAAGSLTPSSTWYYRVFANNGSLDGEWATEIMHTLGGATTAVDLTWDAVAGATKYFVLATQVSGDYNDTAKHTFWTGGTSATSYTHTDPTPNYYCWYRPSGVPTIYVDGGSAGTPLDFEDIEDASVAGGWNNVLHEQVVNDVEYVLGNEISNSYVVDANLFFGYVSTTYFKQIKAHIMILGNLYCDSTDCQLFQLGDKSGDSARYGCELDVRNGGGIGLSAVVVNIYDTVIVVGSGYYSEWRRTPVGHYYDYTWKRVNLAMGHSSNTMRMNGSRLAGEMSVTFAGATTEMKWNTLCGMLSATGRMTFENMVSRGSSNRAGFYYKGGCTTRECEYPSGNKWDIAWDSKFPSDPHNHLVDCIFRNGGTTDPMGKWRNYNSLGDDDLLFEHLFNPIFVDTDGNPLNGYTVVLKDKDEATIINDVTDADGMLSAGSVDVVKRRITADPGFTSVWGFENKYLSWMISEGYYNEDIRNPHTLTVSKDGTDYMEAALNIEAKMTSYVIVNLEGGGGFPVINGSPIILGARC